MFVIALTAAPRSCIWSHVGQTKKKAKKTNKTACGLFFNCGKREERE